MKKKVPVSRFKHLSGTISLVLFLIILLGGFLIVLKVAQQSSQQASASTAGQQAVHPQAGTTNASSLGVYIGTGDGALEKRDAGTGTLLWRFKTQGTSIPAAASIVAGVVYLGSQEGNVYALHASDGTLLWQFPTGAAVVASPTVVNGVVYVGSSNSTLYALNASTGKALWRYMAGPANVVVTINAVVMSNGVIYGSSSDQISQSYLFAVDAATGAQIWRIQVHNQSFTAPQIVNTTLYLASWALKQQGGPDVTDSYVYAYSASNGSLLWRSDKVGDYIIATPTVVNGVVYCGSRDTFLYAFKADTGKLLRRTHLGGAVFSSPQVDGGVIYVGIIATSSAAAVNSTIDTTQPQGTLVAINANTGVQLWQQVIANYQGTPVAVSQATLYVGAADGSIYALNATNGLTIWSQQGTNGVVLPFDNAPITVAP